MCYENDMRVRNAGRDGLGPIILFDEDGDEYEADVPTCFEVCPTCDGEGKHVNPSIDAHGISAEEFDEDPDFLEAYTSGAYDVPCYQCSGLRVVKVVDFDRLDKIDPALAAKVRQHFDDEAQARHEDAQARRMGY